MFRLPIVKFFSRILNRITITVVLVALQVAWLLWAFFSLTTGRVWVNVGLQLLSLLMMLYLVRKDENSAYKIGWIVLMGVLPLLGGALYLAFGNKRPAKRLRLKMQAVEDAHKKDLVQEPGVLEGLDAREQGQSRYVAKYGPYPAWQNTRTQYFACGEAMYPQLLQDLERAEHTIFVEYFIVHTGKMWDGVEAILRHKAAQGVDVRLIYDDFGSLLGLPTDFVVRMERAHIRCIPFNPVVPLLSLVMNHRDHRKIVVIDGTVAYTGGVNLADEYINARVRFGYWKDAAIRLTGECVWSFTSMFLELWDYILKIESDYTFYRATSMEKHRLQEKIHADEKGFVQPYTDSPLDHEDVGENVYLNIISRAKKYLYIFTPYLIIGSEMRTALVNAAKSGVDVRLVVPGIPDKKLVYFLTQSNFPYLIKNGVKIYTYTPGFIHAKCFVSDDVQATVGTVNMDYRSLCLHFECGVWMYRTRAVLQVKEDALKTFAESHEVTLEEFQKKSFLVRTFMGALKLFAPLL